MPALRNNVLKLYDDIEDKLKGNPASIKYHHSYPSGLYQHTLEVMQFALSIFELYKEDFVKHFTRDDVILIAFIHDLEKITKYKRNPSPAAGKTKTDTYFLYNYGKIDMNDAAEVINLIARYGIFLTDMQVNGIVFHHGGWAPEKGRLTELAALIHIADLLSVNIGQVDKMEDENGDSQTNTENSST